MATFQIYDREDSEPVAVKEGFNFNAFIAIFIWALFNRLWLAGIWGGILWIVFQNYVAEISIVVADLMPIEDDYSSLAVSTFIVWSIPHFIFGGTGNEMLGSKLTEDGYTIALTIEADSAKKALDEYNGNKIREKEALAREREAVARTREYFKKVNQKKSDKLNQALDVATKKAENANTAPRRPLPSKISSQTLYIRQKREINRKLKQNLITKKTAEAQLQKAAELEEMRLIIQNKGKKPKIKKEVIPNKTTSKSKENFDYIEKLKDITALKDEGAISQAEFKKLKKKIMDTI